MKRREFVTLLGGAAAWPLAARAQQNRRPWRIAFPEEGAGFAGATKRFDAFRNGLRELGYTDDNSIIDRRVANGRDELVALCQNMITHGADVIVAGSSNLALAAQEATKTVPIVIRAAADPVDARLVVSLARPGGNITGVTSQAADLSAKRLEFLKQLLPQLHRVAILFEPNAAASRNSMRETEAAAHTLGIQIEGFGVNGAADLSATFQSIAAGRFDALDVLASPIVTGNRAQILDFCRQARIPGIFQERPFVEAGGLFSYGPNFERLFHRMAYFVDRILKGAKPEELPVERPTKFEFVINLKIAKALGLDVPPTLLALADEVIE